jgi:8-oxo-dGTP pyrophosphatase MutT (NUDIX family)
VVISRRVQVHGPRRELSEEMGIRDVPLTPLFTFAFTDAHLYVWGRVFACVYDGEVVLQVDEVESGAFVPLDALLRHIHTAPYAPDGLEVLRRYLNVVDRA